MKSFTWTFLAVGLLLAACAPASTPLPTIPPAPTAAGPTSVPPSTQAPTLAPVALAGPQAGTTMAWLDGSILDYVPAGDFIMGMGVGDAPQKTVTLDSYWITETDVTNRMYAQCVATGNCAPPAQELGTPVYTNPAYGNYPVVGVTWDIAANYCKWIQGALPTEAQWEKAARGQDGGVYPWGAQNADCELANYKGCLSHTSGVNDYPAGRSPYGPLDMAGNVYQWVSDFYDEHYYDSMPAQNPTGPASGTQHVIRGSSFESEAAQVLSGIRHFGAPSYHNYDLGFRCVVSQPKAIAPYCQSSSYIPTGKVSTTGACQVPDTTVKGNYCASKSGYTTLQIPPGAAFQVTSKDFKCTDATVNGQRILTCSGPGNSTGQVKICNAACSGQPTETGNTAVCDPGYSLDASRTTCTYAPVPAQPPAAGCPAGYNLIDRGGQKLCALGLNQNGQCQAGTYFDGQYGGCVSPSGAASPPYGIDNPAQASQAYQGCAPGYSYDSQFQCCQASAGGAYPGCPEGFVFDDSQKTCVPEQVRLSGPGCVVVSLNIARCTQPVEICGSFPNEQQCVRHNFTCQWSEAHDACEPLKKP